MSVRRKAGDIVIKRENAGFVGERLKVRVEPEEETRIINGKSVDCRTFCFTHDECTDPECREWANLAVLGTNNEVVGYCYHVTECEMEDTLA